MENLLSNLFLEDIKENGNSTYISQIAIITTKSLLPSRELVGNILDYERLNQELILLKDYRVGESSTWMNILGSFDSNIYFEEKDDGSYSRIIPIVLSNTKYEMIEQEIIKNTLFFTGNIESLLENIIIGRFLYLLIEKDENIVEGLKDKIINISQKEFLDKYEGLYKAPIDFYPTDFRIKFERERIALLNILNGFESRNYPFVRDLMNIINGEEPITILGSIVAGPLGNEEYAELDRFYLNMNKYLLNLRKSRINPDNLKIDKYILPNIFDYNENQIFFHSLLGDSMVIKKEVRNNILTSRIKTKSGIYLFKRDLT